MRWRIFSVNPKCFTSAKFSNFLLAISVFGFHPSHMIWIYTSSFSVFTCRTISLLVTIKASVLLHYTHTPTQLLVTLCIDAVVPIPTTLHSVKTASTNVMSLCRSDAAQCQQKDTQPTATPYVNKKSSLRSLGVVTLPVKLVVMGIRETSRNAICSPFTVIILTR